jgi:hypothetical protein
VQSYYLGLHAAFSTGLEDRVDAMWVQVKGVGVALTEQQGEAVLAAVAPFQQSYLGSCLMRMSDAASSTFPGGNRALPTSAELQKFIGCTCLSCLTCGTQPRCLCS